VAYFGFALPWVAFLAMPGLLQQNSVDYKQLWRFFYYFMMASPRHENQAIHLDTSNNLKY